MALRTARLATSSRRTAMLWARHLLDRPGWIANPTSIRTTANELVLAHCTVAPSLVEEVELCTHFESGIGVGLHDPLRRGDVTLIRIGGADLDRCWIGDGRVTSTGASAHLLGPIRSRSG